MASRLRTTFIVVAAWTLVALAWTPPTLLVDTQYAGRHDTFAGLFLFVLTGFVPWMIATPGFFWLARRFPVREGRIVSALLIHAAIGVVAVPAIIFLGYAATRLAFQQDAHATFTLAGLMGPMVITTFYSVPTYVAVAAIGQAMSYFERYRLRERLLARAELRALEGQLNPHFLFNTLNAISALGYRDPAQADKALTQLAATLRLALKERPQEIALRDEIAFINDYLEIWQLLMPGKMNVSFSIAPEAWRAAVPAMVLQPLVENAVGHGISKLPEGGLLMLSAKHEGERLHITVYNSAPEAEAVNEGAGIGLANVRERLRVLHGDNASLDFKREPKDALAEIDLPFRELPA